MNILDLISNLFDRFKDPKKLNQILICIIISETIGGFFYIKGLQERAKPVNEMKVAHSKTVSLIQKEHAFEIRIYNHRIDSLETVIIEKEGELSILRVKLSELREKHGDNEYIELLEAEIVFKEYEIEFYKKKLTYMKDQLQKIQEPIEEPKIEEPRKENLVINVSKGDTLDDLAIDVSQLDLTSKFSYEDKIKSSRVIVSQGTTAYTLSGLKDKLDISSHQKEEAVFPTITSIIEDTVYIFTGFRKKPKALSDIEAKLMVIKYNFFDSRCNGRGRGFANQFEKQEIKGDDVIIDYASDLMWQPGGSADFMSFNNAKSWIKAFNRQGYAGFHDWRLPTLEEALSILERRKQKNNLYVDFLFNTKQKWIWTADSVKKESKAWFIFFHRGQYYKSLFKHKYYVRAVRTIKSCELLAKK